MGVGRNLKLINLKLINLKLISVPPSVSSRKGIKKFSSYEHLKDHSQWETRIIVDNDGIAKVDIMFNDYNISALIFSSKTNI